MSRNKNRKKAVNDLKFYRDLLDSRGIRQLEQYRTLVLKNYKEESVEYFEYSWTQGDTFWKLSDKIYGDPKYWYLIARFNNSPTEAHVSIGDTIKIPINLTTALQVVG